MDALSDVLDLVRLTGVVYFRTDFAAPWGMTLPAGPNAQFHLIVRGRCFLRAPGLRDGPLELSQGDILVFPQGDAHVISDQPDGATIPGAEVMKAYRRGAPPFPGDGPRTTIMCGHFGFDRRFDHRLLRDLPRLIHLEQSAPHQLSWLETVTAAIIQETGSDRPGAEVVVNRLAEVLFVQVLRSHAGEARPSRGYLAALQDPRINEAITIIHGAVEAPLSLEGIATQVGMSRSAFAGRFADLVGVTPMSYVNDWRMLKARELLETTAAPIADICARVGYQSEAAFSRSFKRRFGEGPGAARRGRTATG